MKRVINIASALGLLLILQFVTGLSILLLSYNENIAHELKSLGILILLFVLKLYFWLIPFYLFLVLINRAYKQNKFSLKIYVFNIVFVYLAYFLVVFNADFWNVYGVWEHQKFSEWIVSERRDLFFSEFSLLSILLFIALDLKTTPTKLT